jgi:hypothetical protein
MGQEKLQKVERSDDTVQANSEIEDEGPGLASQSPAIIIQDPVTQAAAAKLR